jgi:hypothetical protein
MCIAEFQKGTVSVVVSSRLSACNRHVHLVALLLSVNSVYLCTIILHSVELSKGKNTNRPLCFHELNHKLLVAPRHPALCVFLP